MKTDCETCCILARKGLKMPEGLSVKYEFKKGRRNRAVELSDGTRMTSARLIIWCKTGRKPAKNETVLHVDGDGFNDDPDNLELLSKRDAGRKINKSNPKVRHWSKRRRNCQSGRMTKYPFEELRRHILNDPDISATQLAEKVGAKGLGFINRFGCFSELKRRAISGKNRPQNLIERIASRISEYLSSMQRRRKKADAPGKARE